MRGGQQFTLVHAARLGQVGGVIPLAHTFAAQADGNRVGRALQAGVVACGFFFVGGQRGRCGRHRDQLAQLFQCQLLVKATHRCDRLQQRQRLGALRGHQRGRLGRGQSLQGAGFPVNPGRVFACVGAHGVDAGQHQRPARLLAGAQRGAGFPAQHVIAQVAVSRHLVKIRQRIRALVAHAHGALFADHAPDPVALFSAELKVPFFINLFGGGLGVAGRQLDQRQRDDLFAHPRQGDFFVSQKLRRVGLQGGQQTQRLGRHHLDRVACGPRPAGLDGQARLAPDVQRAQLFGGQHALGGGAATFVCIALGIPGLADLIDQRSAVVGVFLVFDEPCKAAHLTVIAHAELRMLGGKAGPVTALAEQQQPVVAHAVFLVAAGVAGKESLHLGGAGQVQPVAQFPVGGPGFERMAAGLRQQGGQARFVGPVEGLAHLQHGFVSAAQGHARGCLRQCRQRAQRAGQGRQSGCSCKFR